MKRKMYIMVILLILITVLLILPLFIKNKKEFNPSFKDRLETVKKYEYKNLMPVGWLQVQGTNIDYPVLTYDIDTFDEETEKINFSWRYDGYKIGDTREVLLGHNIINVSSQPLKDLKKLSNFESLMLFSYQDFAKENLYISYTKDSGESIYKIYAIGFYDYEADEVENVEGNDKSNFIKEVKDNSIYKYDVDVNENDLLLTLKTCTRFFGTYEKQQFIINARKLREDEKIEKYGVALTENYDIIKENRSD